MDKILNEVRSATMAPLTLPSPSRDEGTTAPVTKTAGTKPYLSIALLMGWDLAMLMFASVASVWIKMVLDAGLDFQIYVALWPVLCVFFIAYSAARLYPVVALSPVEEFRRLTWCTTFIYLALAAATFLFKGGEAFSRAVFLMGWLLSIVLVPLGRAYLRYRVAHLKWWGYPVFILGAGKTGETVVRSLHKEPGLGLKPIALFDDDPSKHGEIAGVPVMGELKYAPDLARQLNVKYAIMAMPGVPCERMVELLELYDQSFSHFIVIPDLFGFSTLRVPSRDIGGILGLEVRQQLLMPIPRFVKRTLDLAITICGGIIVLPLIGIITLLIKFDSAGPAFYVQNRLGVGGKHFKAWKFRTMQGDGEARLKDLLAKDPVLRAEYGKYHKLKNDPRITRIGRFLRKSSLDELPQIWNVLKGEMALVGPRPYLEREICDMEQKEGVILKVRPGITGMWQVSDRSEVSFSDRLTLDIYYVRNWSVWLDVYILARTVRVVLFGGGAY